MHGRRGMTSTKASAGGPRTPNRDLRTPGSLAEVGLGPVPPIGGAGDLRPDDRKPGGRAPGSDLPKAILIVEDDAGLREVLAGLFAERGHAVIEAGHGEEACRVVTTRSFDLVVLDILLPGRSGLQVLRALRTRARETPVVVLTGYPDHPDTRAALTLGPVQLLRKPLRPRDLDELLGGGLPGA